MVVDILLIFFYLAEMYIFIYLLFVALPKAFLRIRDGVATFLVKSKRKASGKGSQNNRKDVYIHYEYDDKYRGK